MESFLSQKKVIICVGSGGVGKTTLAASIGVVAAQSGLKVLVLTIDPAKRLATALGLDTDMEGEVLVPNQNFKGQLYALLVQPQRVFDRFIRKHSSSQTDFEGLLKNQLYQHLTTAFSGTQEFTSLESLAGAVQSGKYDLVILDTPPTQHAIDFLTAPGKLASLFQESITKWFISSPEEDGLLKKIFHRGTRTVFSALEKITGSDFIAELADFFERIQSLQGSISSRSKDVQDLLRDQNTSFVLVTGFNHGQMSEAQFFYQEIKRQGIHLGSVIVNRAFPEWRGSANVELGKRLENQRFNRLESLYKMIGNYFDDREKEYVDFKKAFPKEVPVIRLAELNYEVVGVDSLSVLGSQLNEKWIKS